MLGKQPDLVRGQASQVARARANVTFGCRPSLAGAMDGGSSAWSSAAKIPVGFWKRCDVFDGEELNLDPETILSPSLSTKSQE